MIDNYVPVTSKIPKILEIDLSYVYPKTMKFEMLRFKFHVNKFMKK